VSQTQPTISAKVAQTTWEPVIVAFLCNWCSYAGADLAGSSRLNYPPNVRVVRVPCSGRVNPMFVIQCFKRGFDGVLIAGCHPGDCHYAKGNYYARRRMPLVQELLGYLGVEPGRIRFDWVSASESGRFAEVVSEVTEAVRKLGPYGRPSPIAVPMLPTDIAPVTETEPVHEQG
jgi:F420-non-reducing hydrogenase iron-sulfur subunit